MKSTIKKKLFISLALIMVAVCMSVTSFAVEKDILASGVCGENLTWELSNDGVLTISGKGEMVDYTWTNFVPTTPWYTYKNSIKKIVVDDGVVSIGSSAFYGLNKVTSVQLSNDILSIKSYAFRGCYNLSEIYLPDNLQYIGNDCFSSCFDLKSINMPDSVTSIGSSAFYACHSLINVKLPAKITTLPAAVFGDCESLESIELPNSITTIGLNCFKGCVALKELVLSKNLVSIGYSCFSGCIKLEKLHIPDTVENIGSSAFYNCTSMQNIHLPNGLKTISDNLFYGCTALQQIEVPSNVTTIDYKAFYNCINLQKIIMPEQLTNIKERAFFNCKKLSNILIPKSVTTIGNKAYGYSENIYDETVLTPGVKIYCYEGSIGATYAQNNNIKCSIIDIIIPTEECAYTGAPISPNVKVIIDNRPLEKNVDYMVSYKNNIDIGTAIAHITFTNDYACIGEVIKNYQIGNLLSKYDITLDREEYQYHTSLPNVTLKSGKDSLVYGKDYEVYYTMSGESWKKPDKDSNRTLWDVGECYVRIVGINQYIGEETVVVNVNKFDMANSRLMTEWVSNGNGSYSSESFEMKNYKYDGTAKTQRGYRVCDDEDTISPKCYDVSYLNNIKAGTATMVIEGKGDFYVGTLNKNFEITGEKEYVINSLIGDNSYARIAGSNRYQTAFDAADALKKAKNIDKFVSIVVAYGDNYADALSGSYLAKIKNAPIVLVNDSSEAITLNYIRSNVKLGGKVYLLGGTGVVSQSFQNSLSGYDVKRLGGTTRFDTNIEILKEAGVTNEELIVCSAYGYADSLSASAIGKPILLVDDDLNQAQIDYLKSININKAYLLGGNTVVTNTVESQLNAYCEVERIFGATRYETSTLVAEKFFSQGCDTAVFVYAQSFPDGLSGAPIACALDGPIILTDNYNYQPAQHIVDQLGIKKAITLGGPTLISNEILNKIMG